MACGLVEQAMVQIDLEPVTLDRNRMLDLPTATPNRVLLAHAFSCEKSQRVIELRGRYEQVDIWNCTNSNRLTTYVIEGERGSGDICVNGAAAHLMKPMDLVIIASWTQIPDVDTDGYDARRVFVDSANRIRD